MADGGGLRVLCPSLVRASLRRLLVRDVRISDRKFVHSGDLSVAEALDRYRKSYALRQLFV